MVDGGWWREVVENGKSPISGDGRLVERGGREW